MGILRILAVALVLATAGAQAAPPNCRAVEAADDKSFEAMIRAPARGEPRRRARGRRQGLQPGGKAGFDAAGARRLHQKLMSATASRPETCLDTHPGLGERSGYSARLEVNERLRRQAERHFAAGDRRALGRHVEKWLLEVPESGAAAYYAGLYLMMAGKPQSLVFEAFEGAVAFYDGEGLSRLSQEDQREARLAALAPRFDR